jgi:hypothetical protein
MNRPSKITMLTAIAFLIGSGGASSADDVYADFPITLKGYDGTSKTSVSYGGQWLAIYFITVLRRLRPLAISAK